MKNANAKIIVRNDEDKKTNKLYQHIYADIELNDGTLLKNVRLDLTFYNRKFMYKLACGLCENEKNNK